MKDIFFILSLIFSFINLSILVNIFRHKKYILVKPSFWFFIFFHAQIQWSATFYSTEIYDSLNNPLVFFIITQVLPLLFIYFTTITFVKEAKSVFFKVSTFRYENYKPQVQQFLNLMLLISVGIIIFYFINIPFSQTGLFQIYTNTDALAATQARENSLKLAATAVKYLYVFFNKFLAIAIIVIFTVQAHYFYQKKINGKAFKYLFLIIVVALFSSLSGARSHGLFVLLGCAITYLFLSNFKIDFTKIGLTIVVLLSFPVYIQIKKYNENFTVANILDGYREIVIRRVLKVPMETGLEWIKYVQYHGFWGLKALSFLEPITGQYVDVANFMMLYSNTNVSVDTGLMNTSFVFSYYSYFGPVALILLPFLVMLLDAALIVINKFKMPLIIPATITTGLSCVNLISTEYHTIFLSYGYFTGLLFYYIVNKSEFLSRLKEIK